MITNSSSIHHSPTSFLYRSVSPNRKQDFTLPTQNPTPRTSPDSQALIPLLEETSISTKQQTSSLETNLFKSALVLKAYALNLSPNWTETSLIQTTQALLAQLPETFSQEEQTRIDNWCEAAMQLTKNYATTFGPDAQFGSFYEGGLWLVAKKMNPDLKHISFSIEKATAQGHSLEQIDNRILINRMPPIITILKLNQCIRGILVSTQKVLGKKRDDLEQKIAAQTESLPATTSLEQERPETLQLKQELETTTQKCCALKHIHTLCKFDDLALPTGKASAAFHIAKHIEPLLQDIERETGFVANRH